MLSLKFLRIGSLVISIAWLVGCSHGPNDGRPSGQQFQSEKGKVIAELEVVPSDTGLRAVVHVRNIGSAPARIVKWLLPTNGKMTTKLFDVLRDGSGVEYRGMMVKRSVSDAGYLEIGPNRSLTAQINLDPDYAVSAPGRYEVTYHAWNQEGPSVDEIKSNTVSVIRK
jgi:hypothetical protein